MEFVARLTVNSVTLNEQSDKLSHCAGECEEGWHCKPREECPSFKEEQAKLDTLTSFSPEWTALLSKLNQLECKTEENGICCKTKGKLEDITDDSASDASDAKYCNKCCIVHTQSRQNRTGTIGELYDASEGVCDVCVQWG